MARRINLYGNHSLTKRGQARKRERQKREGMLLEQGWKHVEGWWISPHTGRRYDKDRAVEVEQLRKAWGGKGPDLSSNRKYRNQYSPPDDY